MFGPARRNRADDFVGDRDNAPARRHRPTTFLPPMRMLSVMTVRVMSGLDNELQPMEKASKLRKWLRQVLGSCG